jgi:hypothetical protein
VENQKIRNEPNLPHPLHPPKPNSQKMQNKPVVLPLKQDNNQAATGVLNIAAASFGVLYARAE